MRLSCEEVEDEIELFDTLDDEINEELAELDDAIKILEEENSTDDIELTETGKAREETETLETIDPMLEELCIGSDFLGSPPQAVSSISEKYK